MISLILDGLIVLLLVTTIAYCVLLNRRLTALRKNEDELQLLIASFNQATARAEAGIGGLKKATDDLRDSLRAQVEDAKALYDELSFIIERGDSLADQIGEAISNSRGEPAAEAGGESAPAVFKEGPSAAGAAPEDGESALRSRAERELLKALNMSQ